MPKTSVEHFWSHVVKTDGCWNSTYRVLTGGYASLRYGGRQWSAHRFSFFLSNGPIPDGMCVCHRCDNRLCVRPDHLFLGTNADNSADMVTKRRAASGIRNRASKLTPENVAYVHANYGRNGLGGMSQPALARMFGVSHVAIGKILRGENRRYELPTNL